MIKRPVCCGYRRDSIAPLCQSKLIRSYNLFYQLEIFLLGYLYTSAVIIEIVFEMNVENIGHIAENLRIMHRIPVLPF